MWIVDAIDRLAPRLARYPGPARALFATTFVAVIISVGLYAVQYSSATGEQQEAKVSLSVTPDVLTATDALNADALNLGGEASTDPFEVDLTYVERRGPDGVHFVANQPYLNAMRDGGPVDARAALSPAPWTAAQRPLVLDVKVTNNRGDTIFVDGAVIEVESSAPDLAPVPVPMTLHDRPRELTVVNQGWGSARDLVLRFNLGRGGAAPSADPPFAHTASLASLDETAAFRLDEGFADEGVDVAALRAAEEGSGTALRARRRAAGPFRLGARLGPDEVSVPLAGQLAYRDPASGALVTMRVRAAVPLTTPQGLGDFQPPTARYRAVELMPEGRGYERRVALSQSIEPGAVDRFQIPVVVARSSRHRVRVRISYGSGADAVTRPLVLDMFVPRLHGES